MPCVHRASSIEMLIRNQPPTIIYWIASGASSSSSLSAPGPLGLTTRRQAYAHTHTHLILSSRSCFFRLSTSTNIKNTHTEYYISHKRPSCIKMRVHFVFGGIYKMGWQRSVCRLTPPRDVRPGPWNGMPSSPISETIKAFEGFVQWWAFELI